MGVRGMTRKAGQAQRVTQELRLALADGMGPQKV